MNNFLNIYYCQWNKDDYQTLLSYRINVLHVKKEIKISLIQ